MACSICNDFKAKDDRGQDWPWVGEFLSLKDLETSIQHGCVTCSLLHDGIVHCVPQLGQAENMPFRTGVGAMQEERHRPYLIVEVWTATGSVFLEFFRSAADPCPWEAIGTAAKLEENTASEKSFQYATECLRTCIEEHTRCNSGVKQGLPTRILDLGGSTVKLYESQNEAVPYMCLSHCWGGQVSITTTTATLSTRKAGIPWSELPLVFQDAITVTRKFGIRYLWIDSLCILQDSRQDWEKEAVKMASFYQGSYLTIAASKSSGSHESLFSTPLPQNEAICLSGSASTGGFSPRPYTIYARRLPGHWNFIRGHFEDFPLLGRGWVYQERLLSSRILHFGSRELIWECMEHTKCECLGVHRRGLFTHPKLEHGEVVRGGNELENLAWRWRQMVTEYTNMKLTHISDLLPALAGVVDEMSAFRDGEYLAGLWQDTLIPDLCWATWDYYSVEVSEAIESQKTGIKECSWRAPTWSWASTDATVEYSNIVDFTDAARVLDVEAVPLNAGRCFGLAKGCTVTLAGRMIQASLQYSRTRPDDRGMVKLVYRLAFETGEPKGSQYCLLPSYPYIAAPEGEGVGHGATVHCLQMGVAIELMYSMLLVTTGNQDQTHKKIGMVRQRMGPEGFEDWYINAKEAVVKIC